MTPWSGAFNLARYMNHTTINPHKCNCELQSRGTAANAVRGGHTSGLHPRRPPVGRTEGAALVTELLENLPPPRLHLFTTRAVMAGEELLFDYGDLYWESMKAVEGAKLSSSSR